MTRLFTGDSRKRTPSYPARVPAVTILALALLLSGCTNNLIGKFFSGANANGVAAANPLSGLPPSGNSAPVAIAQVIKDTQSPSSTFDLIGDNSGSMGVNCTATDGTATNVGASTCTCTYTFSSTGGVTQSFEVPTSYHEANLLRCSYVGVPLASSSVKVKIHLTASDTYSNEITYQFSGNGQSLDTASASTFARIQRYQCRDIVTVPYLFDPNTIYDPFQSEDPRNTYGINFYTSNFGGTFSVFAGGSNGIDAAVGWNCPAIPNDPSAGLDLNVFSVAADSAGSKRIYPPAGSAFDRSTFHLARNPTGVFSVPVNAYIAPNAHSVSLDAQGNANGPPPIGYGALPIPTGTQGQETCPDPSIVIPSGYHWVKVFLFRMALPTRKSLTSSHLQSLGEIRCAPNEWDPNLNPYPPATSDTRHPFNDCYKDSAAAVDGAAPQRYQHLGEGHYQTDVNPTTLANRFFSGTAMCVILQGSSPAEIPGAPQVAPGPGATSQEAAGVDSLIGTFGAFDYPLGADVWKPNNRDTSYSCVGTNPVDKGYANLCTPAGAAGGSNIGNVPFDLQLGTQNIDDPANPRFDFLFVVTPASVNSGDMGNSASAVHNIYTPYRFMAPGDCNSADPDAPAAGDCQASHALRNYGLKYHDVGNAGDPPANDPNRPGVFPVCALQPN